MTAASLALGVGAAMAAGVGLTAYGMFAPGSRLFGHVYSQGAPGQPGVALTFDDGPSPELTPRILDLLAERGAKATFFLIGANARRHPGLVRRITDEGHLIGNHSYDHWRLGTLRQEPYWADQILRTRDALRDISGLSPRLFRPPMGFRNPPMCWIARRCDAPIVTWNRRAYDTLPTSAPRIVARLKPRLQARDIVLLHDGAEPGRAVRSQATVEAVPLILDVLSDRSLPTQRIDDILQIPGYSEIEPPESAECLPHPPDTR